MKVLVDDAVALAKRKQVEAIVRAILGERALGRQFVVSVHRLLPGRGWTVYIQDLDDRALVEAIQTALRKAGV